MENNKGLLIHPSVDGVANFAKWFNGSMATDEIGRPVVVYHGTQSVFDEFSSELIGSRFSADEVGFFFTNNPRLASHFADPESEYVLAGMTSMRPPLCGANVIPAYLSIKKPLTIDDYYYAYDANEESCLTSRGISITDFYDDHRHSLLEMAKFHECDGIMLKHKNEILYLVFSATQIKSAIGNSGLFAIGSESLVDLKEIRPECTIELLSGGLSLNLSGTNDMLNEEVKKLKMR